MKILGEVDETKRPTNLIVHMKVSFGPGFHSGQLTRRQFVEKLRAAAKKNPPSFLAHMFEHYADHIEAAAKHIKSQKYSLDAPANIEIDNAYYGEGSCSGCSSSHPGSSCCLCEHDGINSCEPCG